MLLDLVSITFFFKLTVNIYFKSSPLFVPCKDFTEIWQRDISTASWSCRHLARYVLLCVVASAILGQSCTSRDLC